MKLTDLIQTGKITRPQGMFWFGPEGTRKTGSAVSPKTLFLDLEHGSDQYNCDRVHIESYRDLIEILDLIIREKDQHDIIVIDPIELAEKLLISETCRQLKIDGLQGLPHGAAWQYLRENFDVQLMARFNEIRRRGRHMIVIGHAQVRTVTLPGLSEPFDRYEPRIDKRNADTIVEWSDATLFFDWDIRTAKNREGLIRAISGTDPIIRVVHGPGWTAKNRIGLTEPLRPEFDALAPLFGTLSTAPVPVEDRPGACTAAGAAAPPATTPPATTPTPDSRTIQAPPDSDEASIEPFLSDQERRAFDALLSSLPQERLLAFLRERGLIHAGEDYHMLGPQYSRRVLADPEGFKEAVRGA
jgi:hypothetical protein